MSKSNLISNAGISATTDLFAGTLNANQIFLSGSANSSSIAGGLQVENGIVVGNASIQGAVSSFTGKDLFVGSGATLYATGSAEVRIRGAGDASIASFTTARSEFVGPVSIQNLAGNYLKLPAITEAQRDALTPAAGMIVLNTTTSKLNFYSGAAWVVITSP